MQPIEIQEDLKVSKQELSIELEAPSTTMGPSLSMGEPLSQEEQDRVQARITVLEQLSALVTSDIKFQDFTREVLLLLSKAVPSEAGSILEVNHTEKTLFFRATSGRVSDKIVNFCVPLGKGIAGNVVETLHPMIVDEAKQNDLHLKSISENLGFEVNNMIAVPVLIRGNLYGVLELINRQGQSSFTEADQTFLVQLCQYAGKFLEVRLIFNALSKGSAATTLSNVA